MDEVVSKWRTTTSSAVENRSDRLAVSGLSFTLLSEVVVIMFGTFVIGCGDDDTVYIHPRVRAKSNGESATSTFNNYCRTHHRALVGTAGAVLK